MRFVNIIVLGLAVVACGRSASKYPPTPLARPATVSPSTPLKIGAATSSWFEGEQLPLPLQTFACVGALDLLNNGVLTVIVVSYESVTTMAKRNDVWGKKTTPLNITPVPPQGDTTFPTLGCGSADFDGDGFIDLVIASGTKGFFLHNNNGDGTFSLQELPPFPTSGVGITRTTSAVPIYPGTGAPPHLYLGRDQETPEQDRGLCHDRGQEGFICDSPEPGTGALFFTNDGHGAFTLASSGADALMKIQALAILDVNGDGHQDLMACNHLQRNRVFLAQGTSTTFFEDTRTDLSPSSSYTCMGVTQGDLDGDGQEDIATSMVGIPYVYLRNGNHFSQIRAEHGFYKVIQWGWGVAMEDFDNSGRLHILYMNQIIDQESWRYICGACTGQQPVSELLLYRNNGEAYFTAEQQFKFPPTAPQGGTALAVADLDSDGILDAIIIRGAKDENHQVWILWGRQREPGNWIAVDAPQGSVVEICVDGNAWCRKREMIGGGSFAAIRPTRLHFGLSDAPEARVRVEWPHTVWHDLGVKQANQLVRFKP